MNSSAHAGSGSCPSCEPLAARLREAAGNPHRRYIPVLQTAMELERQGALELFAGDCPLEEAGDVLEAEEHYTVCHYLRCRSCGAVWFVGACIRGEPKYRRVDDITREPLDTLLWGRCGCRWKARGRAASS